jgi:hypothetical protein
MTDREKIIATMAGVYVLAVLILLVLGFGIDSEVSGLCFLMVIVMTLPWSIVSVLFLWSLAHGAGLGGFSSLYLLFGVINGYLLGRWAARGYG